MKIKIITTLSETERAALEACRDKLNSICLSMSCPQGGCATCPLDAITDCAHDLADQISDKLNELQTEKKGE